MNTTENRLIDFVYQIQAKRRSGWMPIFCSKTGMPMEYSDFDEAVNQASLLAANFSFIRVVKIEWSLIKEY